MCIRDRRSDQPLGVSLDRGASGASWGNLEHPDALLRAGEQLRDAGATAIAVVARFPEDLGSKALTSYRQGSGVDALAGAEAVISHLLVRHLQMPCAHAPALAPLPLDPQLDPRAAGEELGYTFLACVLVGLSQAPDLIDTSAALTGDVHASQIGAAVVPEGALGGEALLACVERGIPVISVANPSLLSVTPAVLGLSSGVLPASSYSEAAGLLVALREGISPAALGRPLPPLREIQ